MSFELLNEISAHFATALSFHAESRALFEFLSLPGYAAIHDYQYHDESMTARNLKRYAITHTERLQPDAPPQDIRLITKLVNDRSRNEIKAAERTQIVQKAFSSYRQWEESTIELYSDIAKQLSESGDMAAYAYIMEIVKSVDAELAHVKDMITDLDGIGWDTIEISARQKTLEELYIFKLRELYRNYGIFHHQNSKE